MKITAIIPARAGSKSIPNQNIRIINGHPLVYYIINTAKRSRYINDIIVTTDSKEVGVVAEQLGVRIRWRDEKLSGDNSTLDAVVYDALEEDKESDYIVTLQPTSPLLSVDTLDNALEYAVSKEYDTVISVINDKRYTWSVTDDKRIPNYEKRINRQDLPANYVETGAFLISKKDIISNNSRVGKKVDIFEIPYNESYGIDSLENLHLIKFLMQRKKSAIYVNGNSERGMGHIYRALEIADELYMKPDIYFNSEETDIGIFGSTRHNLIAVKNDEDLFDACRRERYEIFINDILNTSATYMAKLRTSLENAKIINFEDDGDGILQADVVFNALYSNNLLSHVYAGENYYIAGRQFLYYEPIQINDKVKRVLITFGGADPQNYTEKLLKIVSKDYYKDYEFLVVVGRANINKDELYKYEAENIKIFYDVKNMPQLMSISDVAITSRGRTGYELALMGIPTIAIAQNEREEKHGFVNNENGFSYIGRCPADDIIEGNLKMYLNMSKEVRQNFQNMMLSHDLRSGRNRVMGIINNL